MTRLVRAWNGFWFRPISGRPLGAFRVLMGLITLAHLGMLSIDLDYWLTDQGILVGTEARELAGPRYSPLLYVQDPASVRAFVAATAGVAVLFTLGWRTRVMGVLLYGAMLSIHHRMIPSNCGADNLLVILLFYLMLSPCGAAFSLDARRDSRRRGGTIAEPLIVPWAQRLIQLQMALIYFNTAVLKCHGSTWLGGTVLHYVLNNPEVIRFDFSYLSRYPVFLNLMSLAALGFEMAIPFLIWARPTRRWVIALGLSFHGAILLIINVPLLGELMTVCYLTFLSPDEFEALSKALNPFRRLRPGSKQAVSIHWRVDSPSSPNTPHVAGAVFDPDTASSRLAS